METVMVEWGHLLWNGDRNGDIDIGDGMGMVVIETVVE